MIKLPFSENSSKGAPFLLHMLKDDRTQYLSLLFKILSNQRCHDFVGHDKITQKKVNKWNVLFSPMESQSFSELHDDACDDGFAAKPKNFVIH